MIWLAGCALAPAPTTPPGDTGGDTAPLATDSAAPPTPCDTIPGAPCDAFPPGTTFLVSTAQGTECATYGSEAVMTATVVGAGEVRFEHHGALDGCGLFVDVPVIVGLDPSASTGSFYWWTGDCDGIYCSDLVTTVSGFPSGTWQLAERRAGLVTFTVP